VGLSPAKYSTLVLGLMAAYVLICLVWVIGNPGEWF